MEDKRPLAATGHLMLRATGARAAAERLVEVGVRQIMIRDGFAVLELRGGTHIVVQEARAEGMTDAPFDLMYDDLDAAHASFREQGFSVSEIRDSGRVHRSFQAVAPEQYRIRVLDSHVGNRVV